MSGHKIYKVLGLGFGDEGKGATVDALARHRDDRQALVVRFNGGAQTAHNVVAGDVHHTFAQFGSSTLAGASTYLSQYVLVDLKALDNEAKALAAHVPEPYRTLYVHRDAQLVTPYHTLLNHAREEARGDAPHGSCGMGIGVARHEAKLFPLQYLTVGAARTLRKEHLELLLIRLRFVAYLGGPDTEARFAKLIESYPTDRVAFELAALAEQVCVVDDLWWSNRVREPDQYFIFEGAQGVLLDETHGFAPHTTWTDCTFRNADLLCAEAGLDPASGYRLGVLRCYATRHGHGPFPSVDPAFAKHLSSDHNKRARWQGDFRGGLLDLFLIRYALRVVGGIDGLAINHLDQLRDAHHDLGAYVDGYFAGRIKKPRLVRTLDPGGVRRSYDAQADWTADWVERVSRSTPAIRRLPADPEEAADRIGFRLGVPIRVTSYGPSAMDRRWR